MKGQLTDKHIDQLDSWIGMGPKIFTLLYKITRDGCNTTTFHQKCDNQEPTVTVLYNQQDSVYGGYGSLSWNSSNAYIQDANAFLFQLKYSGSNKFTKFPVKNIGHGVYGGASSGPTFGGGHDLYTFKDTVNSSGGNFAFNGNTAGFGHSFNNQGLNVDQVNNGNMQVTKLEVYSVTGLQRKKIAQQHWRKTPEWNKQNLETRKEDIVSFKTSGKRGLSDVRILMLGPVGTGKSSFYNAINSLFKGRISFSAPCGVGSKGISLVYTPYEVNASSGAMLNFRLCDTRGLEVTQGLNILECNYLLDGNIPDVNQFNPVAPINPDNPWFVHQPSVTKKIHCVCL